jgi:hypothetical protein
MPKIDCNCEQCELENEHGAMVPGVEVICSKCGYITQSFGTGQRSVKRCLALLREQCPMGEKNYYVAEIPDEPERPAKKESAPDAEVVYDESDVPF